jgi:hypothetical protein
MTLFCVNWSDRNDFYDGRWGRIGCAGITSVCLTVAAGHDQQRYSNGTDGAAQQKTDEKTERKEHAFDLH